MKINLAKSSIVSLIFVFAALPVAAQTKAQQALQLMVATERAFSHMSEETGIRESFAAFIADDGILFRPRAVKGKEWMQQHPLPPSKTRPLLTWQPIFAVMSRSGDLGYTTGPWQYKNNIKDAKPSAFGNFMTVWKRQADGSWKFVLDLGIDNPDPKTIVAPSFTALSGKLSRPKTALARANLLAEEQKFSQLSANRGAVEAFLMFASPEVRLYRNGHQPFIGRRHAVRALQPLAISWTWTPSFGDVSSSGDLGYSYGNYELRDKISDKLIEAGNYAHVWKKERGVWKLVIDVANPVPPGP